MLVCDLWTSLLSHAKTNPLIEHIQQKRKKSIRRNVLQSTKHQNIIHRKQNQQQSPAALPSNTSQVPQIKYRKQRNKAKKKKKIKILVGLNIFQWLTRKTRGNQSFSSRTMRMAATSATQNHSTSLRVGGVVVMFATPMMMVMINLAALKNQLHMLSLLSNGRGVTGSFLHPHLYIPHYLGSLYQYSIIIGSRCGASNSKQVCLVKKSV